MSTTTLAKINDVSIQLVTDNGQQLVPIRPICEALGIDEDVQNRKLKNDDFLNSTATLRVAVGADGKDREMTCLPLEFIFGWLFTINPKNVNPEAREAVARYRIECYRALYRHFAAQSEFLKAKQDKINMKIEKYDALRAGFREAEKRLKVAKQQLYIVKDYTFEQWEANNRQMVLFEEEEE